MMKVELQMGSAGIRVEGELADVERILAAYWKPPEAAARATNSMNGETDSLELPPGKVGPIRQSSAKRKRAPAPSKASQSAKLDADGIDAEQLANDIKMHDLYSEIRSKVLDVKGDWIHKCRAVALIAQKPITSGDVGRVMAVLRVKVSLPRLSEALSRNAGDFLTQGTSPVKYTMTTASEDAFKAWLMASSQSSSA